MSYNTRKFQIDGSIACSVILVEEVGVFGKSPSNSNVEGKQQSSDLQKPIKCLDPDNVYQLEKEKDREKNIRYEISPAEQQTIQGIYICCEEEENMLSFKMTSVH